MILSGHVRYHDALEPLLVPIETLTPHPENYNMGDEEAVTESMIVSGMYRPVIAQRSTGYVLAGNTTFASVQAMGALVVPAILLDVDDETGFRIMVGDNEIARRAIRNRSELIDRLTTLTESERGLLGTGVSTEDLSRMQELEEMPLHFRLDSHRVTFSVEVPQELVRAYRHMTREADTDEERFELMLRLGGWTGKD